MSNTLFYNHICILNYAKLIEYLDCSAVTTIQQPPNLKCAPHVHLYIEIIVDTFDSLQNMIYDHNKYRTNVTYNYILVNIIIILHWHYYAACMFWIIFIQNNKWIIHQLTILLIMIYNFKKITYKKCQHTHIKTTKPFFYWIVIIISL